LISGNATGDVLMPAVNQIQYHVGMGPDPEGIVSYCESKGIQIEAYSPLGDRDVLINGDLVNQIGAGHNKSGVQVALRWIYQHGAVLTTKSSNQKHLLSDMDIFDWSLSAEDMEQLDAATSPSATPSFMCSDKPSFIDSLKESFNFL
jgi:diketogulonate reductase-like aldo/keto reductase